MKSHQTERVVALAKAAGLELREVSHFEIDPAGSVGENEAIARATAADLGLDLGPRAPIEATTWESDSSAFGFLGAIVRLEFQSGAMLQWILRAGPDFDVVSRTASPEAAIVDALLWESWRCGDTEAACRQADEAACRMARVGLTSDVRSTKPAT